MANYMVTRFRDDFEWNYSTMIPGMHTGFSCKHCEKTATGFLEHSPECKKFPSMVSYSNGGRNMNSVHLSEPPTKVMNTSTTRGPDASRNR